MAKQMFEIKYRCMSASCAANCREGLLELEEGMFNDLSAGCEEDDLFKSPKGYCRLGFSRPFKVLSLRKSDTGMDRRARELDPANDPIAILIAEHMEILKQLEVVEHHLSKRNIDALWISTCDLGNALMLHSGVKEEEVLVPEMTEVVPLGESLVQIIKEDHREVMSLLYAFRSALEDNVINDSVLISMIVSLKSHIRKEDNEFFQMVNKYIDDPARKVIVEGMRRVEAEFVPVPPGDRIVLGKARQSEREKRAFLNETELAIRQNMADGGCCGH